MNQYTLFPGVNYRLGPTRQLPLSGDYITRLMDVVKRTDPGLTIDVTSAGQVPEGYARSTHRQRPPRHRPQRPRPLLRSRPSRDGNPTVDLGDSILNVPGAIRKGVMGEFSEADARKLKTIMIFQNAMGITQMFNLTAADLPD